MFHDLPNIIYFRNSLTINMLTININPSDFLP